MSRRNCPCHYVHLNFIIRSVTRLIVVCMLMPCIPFQTFDSIWFIQSIKTEYKLLPLYFFYFILFRFFEKLVSQLPPVVKRSFVFLLSLSTLKTTVKTILKKINKLNFVYGVLLYWLTALKLVDLISLHVFEMLMSKNNFLSTISLFTVVMKSDHM